MKSACLACHLDGEVTLVRSKRACHFNYTFWDKDNTDLRRLQRLSANGLLPSLARLGLKGVHGGFSLRALGLSTEDINWMMNRRRRKVKSRDHYG